MNQHFGYTMGFHSLDFSLEPQKVEMKAGERILAVRVVKDTIYLITIRPLNAEPVDRIFIIRAPGGEISPETGASQMYVDSFVFNNEFLGSVFELPNPVRQV